MHRILEDERIAAHESELGRERIKRAAEEVIGRARLCGDEGEYDAIVAAVRNRLDDLRVKAPFPVINATGVILHTNLGRAPLSSDAAAAIEQLAGRYSNLEYDVATGERGSRNAEIGEALRAATGAEDALVVNNCAAAVLLVLDTLAKGREVIVARNQLVEIGGGFRVPDVLERSGAKLVEVGTTNRVYIEDFERALSPQTGLLLRTHASNYKIEGFTHEPSTRDLTALGQRAGVPVVEDLGSGALCDLAEYGAAHERTVQEAIGDGMTLVTFSGDKLLGGPQAGIVAGRAYLVARLRNNPLLRALRVGKLTLAALGATLRCHRDRISRERLPLYRMLAATLDGLRERAKAYINEVPGAAACESDAYVGGGALPQARIPSIAIAIPSEKPQALAAALRTGDPAIVARIESGRVLLDLRTVAPEEDRIVISSLIVKGVFSIEPG
ncbi:MAG TPA: L-seryl-tRNA(Sec) selenium transferase [Candidatus Cybelea sp.]|nr:L-seryl-tRNA(Sec) selenium transferase [Candidatus Cybelea sp.]